MFIHPSVAWDTGTSSPRTLVGSSQIPQSTYHQILFQSLLVLLPQFPSHALTSPALASTRVPGCAASKGIPPVLVASFVGISLFPGTPDSPQVSMSSMPSWPNSGHISIPSFRFQSLSAARRCRLSGRRAPLADEKSGRSPPNAVRPVGGLPRSDKIIHFLYHQCPSC